LSGEVPLSERGVAQRQSSNVQTDAWMKSPVTIWPNVAPGTGFFAAETAGPIRSNAPAGTERPQAESKKARQSRAQVASLHKATDSQTGGGRRQAVPHLSQAP